MHTSCTHHAHITSSAHAYITLLSRPKQHAAEQSGYVYGRDQDRRGGEHGGCAGCLSASAR
eukprot:1596484-Rhodomonas_salina.1